MPIYEFSCDVCQCRFEKLVFTSDLEMPKCPSCCTANVRKLISAGTIRAEGIATGTGGFKAPACKPSG
jgi:putative FmdB family regulatory protein